MAEIKSIFLLEKMIPQDSWARVINLFVNRKLEHPCQVNIESRRLLQGVKPSFRSIAYFRKDGSAAAIKAAFRYFCYASAGLRIDRTLNHCY